MVIPKVDWDIKTPFSSFIIHSASKPSRDSINAFPLLKFNTESAVAKASESIESVSYTHLPLPTKA